MQPDDAAAPRVPRTWPDATIVCVASGPSLTTEDVEACRTHPVIVANDAYRLAPWALALYASDADWWQVHNGAQGFSGAKWTVDHPRNRRFPEWPEIQRLRWAGHGGVSLDPGAISTGCNSGYAAINLAVLYGATRVLLLGYDMGHGRKGPTHFFGSRPGRPASPYAQFIARFKDAAPLLKRAGVTVINCSRETALTCFPRQSLAEALA